MEVFTELVKGLAALAWPVLTFYIFWSLRAEVKNLLGRIRRGKILGQELELDQQLDQLTKIVGIAKQELPEKPVAEEQERASREAVLGEGAMSPLATFVKVARALEHSANNVLERTGWGHGRRRLSLMQAFRMMPPDWVSEDVMRSIALFSDIRNRIVHGVDQVSNDELLRAIDLGFQLLDVVKNYEIEENRVRGELVDVYEDPLATRLLRGVKGVRLTSTHPSRSEPQTRIYPTTKDWFVPGMLVSWDWDLSHTWGAAWYRDPEDGQVKEAGGSAGEFVGRVLAEPETLARA